MRFESVGITQVKRVCKKAKVVGIDMKATLMAVFKAVQTTKQ